MPLYRYIKAPPQRVRKKAPMVVSFILMLLGGSMLVWVGWPILSFAAFASALFPSIVSPIADGGVVIRPASSVLSPVVLAASAQPTESDASFTDFTNANLWFPTSPQKKVLNAEKTYTLSIPTLGIRDVMVTIAGDDLNKSLIHYGGTGLPGQYGNSVIFGHSTLPQFFSPTNYRTIFSTLPTLKVGDEFFVTYDEVTYRYKVFDMVVKDPEDLSALEQHFDDSYVTLITCVPPGTYWKRLNIKARIVSD